MREIENFEAGMTVGLMFTSIGLRNAATGIGAGIAEDIADARWEKQIRAHARANAQAAIAADKEKAANSATANSLLVSLMLAAHRKGLRIAA